MLTDDDLALRITNFEDNFVERKTAADSRRWIPALVAFANSAPINFPCVLFIGVKDDGTVEEGNTNLESLQKTFAEKATDVFPPIPYYAKILSRNGKQCLAIIVPGSAERPHYAGIPYLRIGSECKKASVEDVARLSAERDPKAYEILKWRGKVVTVEMLNPPTALFSLGRVMTTIMSRIRDCNQFYVTFEDSQGEVSSMILRRIELSFDHQRNQLKLEIASA